MQPVSPWVYSSLGINKQPAPLNEILRQRRARIFLVRSSARVDRDFVPSVVLETKRVVENRAYTSIKADVVVTLGSSVVRSLSSAGRSINAKASCAPLRAAKEHRRIIVLAGYCFSRFDPFPGTTVASRGRFRIFKVLN